MAFSSGHKAFVLVDNVAGTPVDLSAYAAQFNFPWPTPMHDTSVFGVSAAQFVPGMPGGGEISMSGPHDVALGTFVNAVHAAQQGGSTTCTITWGPAGSVAGETKDDVECWVGPYEVTAGVDGAVNYTCSFQMTGVATRGTW